MGVGLPLLAVALWGLFAAPQALIDSAVLAFAIRALVLGGAVVALATSGYPRLGAVLGALIVSGLVLTSVASASAAGA